MTRTRSCPKCGTQLIGGSPGGLCPVCTARLISSFDPSAAPEQAGPGGLSTTPPSDFRSAARPEAATGLANGKSGSDQYLRRVGDYELLEEIARGGMGVVYKARQVGLNRIVAVKMMLAGPFASESFIHRFRLEAETAAGLQHPNIVPIYEIGQHDGQHYFAMAYIEGRSLADLFRDQRMSPRDAAECLLTISETIHYAHQRGIIHRDLKPSNVLVDNSGGLRITDFGLARQIQSPSKITATGELFGSPSYMAPEQAFGPRGEVGVRSDVYSLGAILYHLLVGQPPFVGSTLEATLRNVASGETAPPSSFSLAVPADLETICLKCLEKDPSRRYGSAQELAGDLRRFLRDEPILARPVTNLEKAWRWCRRNPVISSLSMITVLLLLVVMVASPIALFHINQERKRADQNAVRSKALAEEGLQKAAESRRRLVRLNVANGTRLVADGDPLSALPWFVAALELERGSPREAIHRTRIELLLQGCPRLVQILSQNPRQDDPNYGKLGGARFSPDGQRVATMASVPAVDSRSIGEVVVWDLASGQPLFPPLQQPGDAFFVDFSGDGKWLVTGGGVIEKGITTSGQARIWDAFTGLPVSPPLEHHGVVFHAGFSGNRSKLVTATRRFANEDSLESEALVWQADATNSVRRLRHGAEVWGVWFGGDDRVVVTAELERKDRGGHVECHARLWDALTGQPLQPPLNIRGFVRDVKFRPDGVRIVGVNSTKPGQAFLWNLNTRQMLIPPLNHGEAVINAAFNADATRVITSSLDSAARIWDTRTGAPVGPPLFHRQGVCHAEFSPDEQRVATASFDFTARLWDANSGKPLSQPLHHSDVVRQVTFSPDGQLLLSSSTDQITRLWRVHQPEADLMALEHGDTVWHAEFSPEGRRILTVSADGTARVWDAATGKPRFPPLTHRSSVFFGCFSSDGRWVATASADDTARVWDATTGQPLTEPLDHQFGVWHVQFSPNGRRLVTSAGPGLWKHFVVKGVWSRGSKIPGLALGAGEAKIWDLPSGKPLFPVLEHGNSPIRADFTPDGRRIVTLGLDHTARSWDATSGQLLEKSAVYSGKLISGGLSPDGRRLAASCGEVPGNPSFVLILDSATCRPQSPPLSHPDIVASAKFSPNNQYLVTACWDGAARIWNLKGGQLAIPPLRHSGQLYDATLSPDGSRLATASAAKTAQIWDAATGEAVTPPLAHPGAVLEASFSPDGRWLVTSCADGKARVWNLLPFNIAVDDLIALGQVFSSQQIEPAGTSLERVNSLTIKRAWERLQPKYPHLFSLPQQKP